MTKKLTLTDEELREAVAAHEWYHTIELRPGVVTPGWFDLRQLAQRLPFPPLHGRRALDVGTFEGFWAFHLASRGAADVVAIDILDPRRWDWPAGSREEVVQALNSRKRHGAGFELVAGALGSQVRREELSVYDLDVAKVGQFDFVYVGSLLLHLRDPVRALERVRSVLAPGGKLLLVDAIDTELSLLHPRRAVAHLDGDGRPWWWRPNTQALLAMVQAAGFEPLGGPTVVHLPVGTGHAALPRLRPRALRNAESRRGLVMRARGGDPHAFVLATPR